MSKRQLFEMSNFWSDHLETILKFGNLIALAIGFFLIAWRQGRFLGSTETTINKQADKIEKNCKSIVENKRNIEALREYTVTKFGEITNSHFITHAQYELKTNNCKQNVYHNMEQLRKEIEESERSHRAELIEVNKNLREMIKDNHKRFDELRDLVYKVHSGEIKNT